MTGIENLAMAAQIHVLLRTHTLANERAMTHLIKMFAFTGAETRPLTHSGYTMKNVMMETRRAVMDAANYALWRMLILVNASTLSPAQMCVLSVAATLL